MKIGKIDQALDYLYSFINYETDSSYSYESIHYNVDRTIRLLDLLGNPQNGMKIIHIAGTKGKGSVCYILNILLGSLDYITGVFTSPHIDRINERITVNGQQIKDEEFIDLLNIFHPLIESFPVDSKPTTFEILTAMAVYYFKMEGVEFAILETGMGGRFDSTNFSDPVLSVITSISYDHVEKLGEHIHQIAAEKAGIIKKSKPVVVGYQVYDVLDIFKKKSVEEGSVFYSTGQLCSYEILNATENGTLFHAKINDLVLKSVFISLPGEHQVENTVLALHALKILGLLPMDRTIRKALKSIHLPARLELIVKDRRYLLDSAHNEDSSRVLVRAVKKAYLYNKLIIVAGIVKGKDIKGILKNLASISDSLIITEPVTCKDLDTDHVFKQARELYPSAVLKKSLKDAIAYASEISGGDDLILITGSFYTTSPARSWITAKTANRLS